MPYLIVDLEEHSYYASDPLSDMHMKEFDTNEIYDEIDSKHQLDIDGKNEPLPDIFPPRCNTYEVPMESITARQKAVAASSKEQDTKNTLEASNVYETPLESANAMSLGAAASGSGSKNINDHLQVHGTSKELVSNVYETPIDTNSMHEASGGSKKESQGHQQVHEARKELEASSVYESPMDTKKLGAASGRSNKESQGHQQTEKELEASNVYEAPMDSFRLGGGACCSSKEGTDRELEASNAYEIPMDSKKKAAAELDTNTDYTPMASVWNYTQYKRT